MPDKIYKGSPNLKAANVEMSFTPEQVQEWIKCADDPVYFTRNYIKIVSLDEGLVPFKMWDFQEDMINRFHANRFNIAKLPRQTGKSTTVVSYLLHYAIFNDNVNIGILANKLTTSRDLTPVNFGSNIFVLTSLSIMPELVEHIHTIRRGDDNYFCTLTRRNGGVYRTKKLFRYMGRDKSKFVQEDEVE